jgi:hypothetical protein
MNVTYVSTYPLLTLEGVPDSTTLPNIDDEIEMESPRTKEVSRYRVANRVWEYTQEGPSGSQIPTVAIILTRLLRTTLPMKPSRAVRDEP